MSGDRRGRGSATASVLERLMRDADFRARFRADPRAALEEIGMADMAEQLSTISDPMQTLQPRESRSSLAGAAMAAALEGIALLDPSGHLVDAASAAPLGGGGGGGRQSGSVVAPLATADMTGSDAGGMLHGSEFAIPDPEGAPGPNGPMHAGYDLFGRAGAPIRSPVAGTVVEVKQSSGTSGQVFGGTVKVQQSDGKVWVFRHVVPGGLSAGQRVGAGQGIAAISNWDGGAPHTHIELWKNLDGGYRVENMEDPLPALRLAYSAPSQVPSTPVADAASASVVEDGGSGDASDSGPGDSSDDSEDDDGDDSGDDSEDDSEDDGGDDAADGVGDDQPDSVDEQTNNLESSDTGSSYSSDDSGSSDSSDGGS
ncbi:MAG: hypothetical protein QOF68_1877, partial [Gaiellales bacterium]|nr:hypothetical protein [Gaiellales bacterium]